MTDYKGLLFATLGVAGLAYCLWKTHSDWRNGFSWIVVWGAAASLSAFLFVAFMFASKALSDL